MSRWNIEEDRSLGEADVGKILYMNGNGTENPVDAVFCLILNGRDEELACKIEFHPRRIFIVDSAGNFIPEWDILIEGREEGPHE